MTELAKTFDPAAIEAKWYAHWETSGQFRPARPDAQPFTIVNPPPNVTGSLHIGHALDNTLQDIVIRYERLRGKDALWVVGTDHAGIATQMVVERQMEARQDKRTNYSREQFIEKVWEWKAESGGTITGQLRRLGCSMDWSREQFTMDPHFTRAVVKVFVDLHKEGLIYRDKRLVNWDPKLKTAISDLEVETHEVQGGFWHFKYPLADGVTLDDHLRGDAGMIGAGLPQRVPPLHAPPADQRVLDGEGQRMADMQAARDVGRRDHDGEGRRAAAGIGAEGAARLPPLIEALFEGGGREGLVEHGRTLGREPPARQEARARIARMARISPGCGPSDGRSRP